MPHARETVRDAFVTALTGLTTTGARVYPSRVYPSGDIHLPGLSIYTQEESLDEDTEVMGTKQFRNLEVVVEARVKLASGADDQLDDIAAEVEAALFADETLGVGVKDLDYGGTTIELEGEDTSKVVGVATMTFVAFYRIDVTDPTSIIA